MTDDLLDEAARLAAEFNRQFPITANTLRALVERVQQAEEALRDVPCEHQRAGYLRMQAERDAARGKLDKVRELVTHRPMYAPTPNETLRLYTEVDLVRDVLAILDGEKG